MAHLIDKDAVLAEIKRRYKLVNKYETNEFCAVASRDELVHLMNFIDTLEVKEVDLDIQTFAKEMDAVFALPSSETKNTEEEPLNWEYAIAKHFYELGMQVSNKAQKGE